MIISLLFLITTINPPNMNKGLECKVDHTPTQSVCYDFLKQRTIHA